MVLLTTKIEDFHQLLVVPRTGFEPVRLSTRDFKSRASTVSPPGRSLTPPARLCPMVRQGEHALVQRNQRVESTLNRGPFRERRHDWRPRTRPVAALPVRCCRAY
jgi:hypothetical protein